MQKSNNPGMVEMFMPKTALVHEITSQMMESHTIDSCQRTLIHRLFERQVEQTPDSVAVVFEGESLTYADLNGRANQLAHYLRALGGRPESLVGICMERSLDLVIGLLGILKAGGAYVPLDPTYPKERLGFILDDAQISVLLTQAHLLHALPEHQARTVCPDISWEVIACQSQENLIGRVTATNLAYVIYTSGSTGRPKGVAIEHRSPAALIRWASHIYTPDEMAGVLASTSICFDLSIFELFVTLCLGGTVILAENALQLPRLLAAGDVTLINTVPSAIAALLRMGGIPTSVKTVNLAGEPLQKRLVQDLYQIPTVQQVYNLYGPSEDTTYSTVALMERHSQEPPSIGRPIEGTQVYILDRDRQPVPAGTAGELYIGGEGLARGYLNRPELTAERFIDNPFEESESSRQPSESSRQYELKTPAPLASPASSASPHSPLPTPQLYKTGDLVRLRPDGNLDFLGRIDHQVKIRGFRIELGEVETVLWDHPAVQAAVVVAREDSLGDQQLVAYVAPKQNLIHAGHTHQTLMRDLRDRLQQTLPHYMVPSGFVMLEALPLTPNGKIDRNALPAPDRSQLLADKFIAPRTATEQSLTDIWADVLGLTSIGIHDHFLELGGHSLLATQIVSRILDAFQVELPLRCVFELPTIAELAQRLETVMQESQRSVSTRIEPQERGNYLPLSSSQRQLWVLDQLVPHRAVYNVPEAVRLSGALNVVALEQSLQAIVQRHESLRTTFAMLDGQPIQVIHSDLTVRLQPIDLSAVQDAETEVQMLIQTEAQRPFDLSQGPLMRAILFRLSETDHILLLNLHHIICDEWSFKVLFAELTALYATLSGQQPWSLAKLTLQYADYALWQQHELQLDTLERQLTYWTQQLSDAPSVLQLPTDHPRSPSPSYRGARHFLTLPQSLTKQLKALSCREGVTLFMTLLAAFQTLLYRYTGQPDVCVGSPIANRHRSEVEGLIGYFINTLVLRTDLAGNPDFRELVKRVREVALSAYAHQDLPFEQVVQAVLPNQRDASYNPLFQVMFNLHNVPMADLSLGDVTLTRLPVDNQTAKFDLSLDLTETATGITGFLEYSTDLFESATIDRLVGHFQTLLEGIVSRPDQPIAMLPLLTVREQQQFAQWNQTQVAFPSVCMHTLFETQVTKTPDAAAITFGADHLTYRTLNERANQLAYYLQQLGVGADVLVGICADRSLDMVVGLLAILKAGGAYVPLDPKYPSDRLEYMLDDSQAAVLLTQTHLAHALPAHQAQVVYLNDIESFAAQSTQNPVSGVNPNNLAYVIYTSGSTGRPKGVAIEHRSPIALIHWAQSVFSPEELAGVLAATSICFDLSVFELFVTLSSGGQVILAQSALCLPKLPAANQVTLINTVPSAIAELLRIQGVPASVHTINLAGEPLPQTLVQQIYQQTSAQKVYNLYGPSEDTTYSTGALILPDERQAPPIGRPINNTQAYVLDQEKQPVPIGVPGELYLGGAGLARGYLGQPELTAARFVNNPFGESAVIGHRSAVSSQNELNTPNSKLSFPTPHTPHPIPFLYKTGDLVRYRPDGNLEFLGRIDHQVKVRGFRIELGEIEAWLRQHPAVQEALVIAREDAPGEKRLVAYLVCHASPAPSVSEFRRYLQTQLPDYMVPAAFVILDAMPLNPNGKIDRKALPTPEGDRPDLEAKFLEPRTATERQMATIWTTILKLETIGSRDHFFELGGNSLLAAQLMMALQTAFQIELPVRHLFEQPTIEGLSRTIDSLQRGLPVFANQIDLQAEAVLDPEIYPTGTAADLEIVRNPNHVFLTGATGFLGAFILYELLLQTQATVHCLVRAANPGAGFQRVQQNLQKYGLWRSDFNTRIQAVPGDLGQPFLGLARREFDRLTEQIDVIYHNGAPVNFVKPYMAMKAESVLGTQEILRLACLKRVKPTHFISTVAVFGTIGYFTGTKMLYETDPLEKGLDYVHMGYTRSKWVAEKLMAIAQSRGLPMTVLRPGLVLGHSQTGITKTDDYPSRLIKGCIQMGSFPDLVDQKEELIPVDYASRAIAHLTRQPESIGNAFHIVPSPGNNIDLVALFDLIQAYGYPLKKLPYTEWKEALLKQTLRSQENALYPLMPFITDRVSQEHLTVMELYQNTPDYDCRNTLAGLAGTDIVCPPINAKLVETCFAYFIESGFLPSPS